MRTARILLLSIMAIVCFASLAAQAKPPVRVVSKELHCSMELPDGWKRQPMAMKNVLLVTGPVSDRFATNINVLTRPAPSSSLPDIKTFSASLRQEYGGKGTLYAIKQTTFGGLSAYSSRAHLRVAGRSDIENRQVFCVYKNSFYIFTFTTTAAQKTKYETVGDKIIASFRFEK